MRKLFDFILFSTFYLLILALCLLLWGLTIFGAYAAWSLLFPKEAHAAELCSAGFKTQDYAPFNTSTPKFTILIPDSTTTPACNGKTGITNTTTGLWVSVRVDNQATATLYTAASSEIQTISTLGTYMAPTAGNVRLKAVSDAAQPGVLEIQLERGTFRVPGSRRVDLCVGGVEDAPDPICEKIYLTQTSSCSGC